MLRRFTFVLGGILAFALVLPSPAPAASFPDRDITLVCPWAAGGGTDTLARTLAKNGKKYFGVNLNVVNKVGGTGAVGMNSVATSKPDGYIVGVITFNLSTYRMIGLAELSYKDFDLIALLNRSPAGFSVKADSQFQTLKDLVEYAKANPGVVTVGHAGPGQPWHLSAALLAKNYNLKFTFVPFDGAAPTRVALVGGHITMASSGMDEMLQFYKTKQIRMLAAVTPARNPFFPEVPSIAEAGYPIENPIFDWRGLGVAKGTPPEILKVLREGFRKAAEDPEYIKLMDELTLPRTYMEYDKFAEFLGGMEKSLAPVLDSVGLLKK
ncbi:MAG TPA: tripartite tricarboxylate transporter substrate binding protein [Candidatus Acidoferrum sp.]|nr:tripartite tricarboxylate transporter substrate binding protein [Candidatus Acidoferrum sp.]